MRRFFVLAGLCASLLGGALHAQQPGGCDPCPCPLAAPALVYAPVAPPACPRSACGNEALIALDLMIGQEAGLRAQLAIFRDNHEAFLIEGFVGELFHNLGSSMALGAGGRWLWQTSWPDCVDSLLFGPGVDVFFQTNHNDLILLTPSFDVAYVSHLGKCLEWEIGLDAGLGIGVSGRTNHGNSGVGDVTPLISAYLGFRF